MPEMAGPADVAALQRAATGGETDVAPEPEPAGAPATADSAATENTATTIDDSIDRAAKATTARRRERIEEVARPSGS